MKLGNMFKKTNQKNYITLTNRKANVQNSGESSPEVPEGLMRKCNLQSSGIGRKYYWQSVYLPEMRQLF